MEQNIEKFSIVPWLNQGWNRYVYPDYRCWIWWGDRGDERAASESSGASSGQWAKLSGAIPKKKKKKKIMAWYVHGLSIFHKFIPEVDRPFVSSLTTEFPPRCFATWNFHLRVWETVMREFAKNKLDIRKNNFFDAIFARETRKWSN